MNIVTSKEKDDCGICALACATGRPWHEVKAAIWAGRAERRLKSSRICKSWDHEPSHSNRTNGIDLIDAALRLGWSGTRRNLTPGNEDWPTLDPSQFAIVQVQYQDTRCSHWVVFDGKLVFDSGWDCPVTAGRTYTLQPLSYLLFVPAL